MLDILFEILAESRSTRISLHILEGKVLSSILEVSCITEIEKLNKYLDNLEQLVQEIDERLENVSHAIFIGVERLN